MADSQGVLVIGEAASGQLDATSKELLAHGRKLAADLHETLAISLLGEDLGKSPQEAIAFGADRVFAVAHPLLKQYQVDTYLAALTKLCEEHPPRVVLLAKTLVGSELGSRLAFRLNSGLAQDCLEVSIEGGQRRLIASRPVYGGNCIARVACTGEPMMATIRPKTTDPLERDDSRRGEVIAVSPLLDPSVVKNRLLERVEEAREGIRLEDARIVVSGGRGLGGPEPFANELQEIARLLKAAVGASRAAVDIGWVPYSYQVGLTGKTISPDLYITVGISGASQHMAGCSGARVIVAINRDREANIFKSARFGVAGDWKKVLAGFIEQLKALA